MATIDVINSFPALSTTPAMPSSDELTADELTVSEAAAILGLPEGGVVELLNSDVIESRYAGNQRLISWDNLDEFNREYKRKRAIMAELTREAQEMGFYDD